MMAGPLMPSRFRMLQDPQFLSPVKAEPSWNGVMDAFARQRSAQVVDPRDLHAAGRWLDGVDREAGERQCLHGEQLGGRERLPVSL